MKSYKPPQTLTIHLSKIAMPELVPKPSTKVSQRPPAARQPSPPHEPSTGPNVLKSKRASPSGGKSPSGNRNSIVGNLNFVASNKGSSSGVINAPQPQQLQPRPGGVSAHNPYNPYGRRQRPNDPALENATLGSNSHKPSRHPSGATPLTAYGESPPGGYPQSSHRTGESGESASQPSTIHDLVKDGVSSIGSSLLGRFGTRK